MLKTLEMVPRSVDLAELLAGIGAGAVVLPEFQRDFDWTEGDVRELLVTVVCGWPAGSLLLMAGEPNFFKVRSFEGAVRASPEVTYTILDGQQRLTGLFHALFDVGSHVYAVDYSELPVKSRSPLDVNAIDDLVRMYRRADWDARYRPLESQLANSLVPFYVLQTASTFYEWRDQILEVAKIEDREAVRTRLTRLYTSVIAPLHKYRFPAVVLDPTLEPAAIARIFERVNRTGQSLSAFDLMVARVYDPLWNMRDKWESARREEVALDRFFKDDGLAVLQVIALRTANDVRQKAVLELNKSLVQDEWDRSASAVADALGFFVSACGVIDPGWLPYFNFILPVGALAAEGRFEGVRDEVGRWFWNRTFTLGYDAASNTRTVADYRALRGDGDQDLILRPASAETLIEATRRGQTAAWRGFMCALSVRGAVDLLDGHLWMDPQSTTDELEFINPKAVVAQSVFPRGLEFSRDEAPPHLRALGFVLLNRETARRLAHQGLIPMLAGAMESDGQHVERALESQLLPPYAELAELLGDWRAFIERRLELLSQFMKAHAGLRIERGVEVTYDETV